MFNLNPFGHLKHYFVRLASFYFNSLSFYSNTHLKTTTGHAMMEVYFRKISPDLKTKMCHVWWKVSSIFRFYVLSKLQMISWYETLAEVQSSDRATRLLRRHKFLWPGLKSERQAIKSLFELQKPALHNQEKPAAVSRSQTLPYWSVLLYILSRI